MIWGVSFVASVAKLQDAMQDASVFKVFVTDTEAEIESCRIVQVTGTTSAHACPAHKTAGRTSATKTLEQPREYITRNIKNRD